MFEPRVVAIEGTNLAVPITSYGQSGMKRFVDVMATRLKKELGRPDPVTEDWFDTAVVPTPGVTMSSRLGACSTCEDVIEKTREHELVKLEGVARQEVAEANRRESRLGAKDFSDPTPPGANVRITLDRDINVPS